MQETWVWSLVGEDPLEKEMATYSSILAWEIPWTEEPVGYSPWGHVTVQHDLATKQVISLLLNSWKHLLSFLWKMVVRHWNFCTKKEMYLVLVSMFCKGNVPAVHEWMWKCSISFLLYIDNPIFIKEIIRSLQDYHNDWRRKHPYKSHWLPLGIYIFTRV